MQGLNGRCVRTYGGVYDLAVEQVGAHSSGRVDAILAHSRTRMGEFVDKLHHGFTDVVEHID
jgi:hypothetical protein